MKPSKVTLLPGNYYLCRCLLLAVVGMTRQRYGFVLLRLRLLIYHATIAMVSACPDPRIVDCD